MTTLSTIPHHNYIEFAIAAAISAMGFSMIYNTPKRLLPVIAVGGIIAVCFRNFVFLGPSNDNIGLDQGLIIGSLAGSTLVSLIITRAQHWFHTPHQCISIPSVIPMVTTAMNYLIKASLVILCITLGVALPHIFVHRLLDSKRKQRLLMAMCERNIKNMGVEE